MTTMTTTDLDGNITTYYINGKCSKCLGTGNLIFYLQCVIKYSTSCQTFISNDSGLPLKKLKKAKGKCLFEQEDTTVSYSDY